MSKLTIVSLVLGSGVLGLTAGWMAGFRRGSIVAAQMCAQEFNSALKGNPQLLKRITKYGRKKYNAPSS